MSETSIKKGPVQLPNKGILMTRRKWGITALGTVAILVVGGSGSIGGYEKGLQDGIEEGTKRAQADAITDALMAQNNLRNLRSVLTGVLTPGYEPPSQRREVLSLPTDAFSSEPLASISEFIGNVPNYLDYMIKDIDRGSNNKNKNLWHKPPSKKEKPRQLALPRFDLPPSERLILAATR